MKFAVPLMLAALLATPAFAQKPAKAASDKKTATAAKPTAKKPVSAGSAKRGNVPAKRQITRRAARAVEEVTPISTELDPTLTEADIAVAQRVFTGPIKCELGANVMVTPDPHKPGFFTVQTRQVRYRMHPVESRTGAIRLEDPRAGAMWLQLGNKSMLMNQKLGQRLADECQSPQQVTAADDLKRNPQRSLLDQDPAPAADVAPAASAPR